MEIIYAAIHSWVKMIAPSNGDFSSRVLLLVFLVPIVLVLMLPMVAMARHGLPPISARMTIQPLDKVAVIPLPAIDTKALAQQAAQAEKPGPAQFAVPAKVQVNPQRDGTWDTLPEGGRLWRVRIAAPGATDLNFGFKPYHLSPGATLHIVSEQEGHYEGPYTARDNKAHRQLWTPSIPGMRAVLELYIPKGAAMPELELIQVGRGFRYPTAGQEVPRK